MKCASIESSLAGFVGGDLRPATATLVAEHVDGCASCGAQLVLHQRAQAGLALLADRDLAPPADLVNSVLERVHGPQRRMIPVPPIPPDALRLLAENRDALASVAGTALVVGGAVWALWRASRRRSGAEPATS